MRRATESIRTVSKAQWQELTKPAAVSFEDAVSQFSKPVSAPVTGRVTDLRPYMARVEAWTKVGFAVGAAPKTCRTLCKLYVRDASDYGMVRGFQLARITNIDPKFKEIREQFKTKDPGVEISSKR